MLGTNILYLPLFFYTDFKRLTVSWENSKPNLDCKNERETKYPYLTLEKLNLGDNFFFLYNPHIISSFFARLLSKAKNMYEIALVP